MPETSDSNPSFDLSRMSEDEVAAAILRQMAAFRRTHNLPDEPLSPPPAPGGSPVSPLSKPRIHPFLDFDAPGEEEETRMAGPRAVVAKGRGAATNERPSRYGPVFTDLLARAAAWRPPHRASRLAAAGVAALLLATGAAAILWELNVAARSRQPSFLIAMVPAPNRSAMREDRLERASGAMAAMAAGSPPALAAKLKPAIPPSASSKAASSRAASAPGPFDPLFDFLSPLTKQLILASQAGGGGKNGNGAANRDVKGNGGNR
jgi:hypothetical protein